MAFVVCWVIIDVHVGGGGEMPLTKSIMVQLSEEGWAKVKPKGRRT